jgi:broad specificity phosphatase PhoE
MAGTAVRIFLARHGETVYNVEGRWQGQADSPLTERGLAQAHLLGAALASEPLAAVYSSDLGRALRTAEAVAAPHQLPVTQDRRLREVHVGTWTGLNREQIEALQPGGLQAWASQPARMVLPGGEPLTAVQERALAFFAERMPPHAGEAIAIITHGAVGQAILVQALGGSIEDLWLKERMDNCQISRLEWSPAMGLRLIEMSDTRHLLEVGTLRTWRTTDTTPTDAG